MAGELSHAQSSLARAISRARAGEDAELSKKVRERGETVAKLLAGVLRLKRMHGAENAAFDVPVSELARAVGELVDLLGTVHVVAVEDQVYVNDVRIPTDSGAGKGLAGELAAHNTGGLTFHGAVTPEAVRALVGVFGARPANGAPRRAAQRALAASGLRKLELTPRVRFIADDDERALLRDAADAMARLLANVEQAYDNVAEGRVLNVLPLRRSAGELLDIGPADPVFWETLGRGPPHASHAVEVALIAMIVGRAAGMRAAFLHDLGVACLAHDMGYAALPKGAAPPEALARHPVEAARVLLRQRGFHVAKLRRLRAILDHHRSPATRDPTSVPGELMRLAEDYTTLVRVYRSRVSPADALGAIARAAGRSYDPVLAQLLVNALGAYPPGTLLEFEDGRLARSVSPARSPATFATPLVRFFDAKTREFARGRVDLAGSGLRVRRALPG